MHRSLQEKASYMKICDLHCDLLAFLGEGGDLMNKEVRCSLPQMQRGGVAFQAMAIFTETKKGSVASAKRQRVAYNTLLTHGAFQEWQGSFSTNKISIALAIENLSGLLEEDEPLDLLFERMVEPFYVSLTWNSENRFGGGNHTSIGLKRDGELFLEYIDGKKIAIDLSHTSDHLAHDILEYIDKRNLKITPIASHSNMRAICNDPRNLPDELASEIVKRGGVIGLNFVRKFVGEQPPRSFVEHVEHLKYLGGGENQVFGADFFYERTIAPNPLVPRPYYHKGFEDASCYPLLLASFGEEQKNIAHANFEAFVARRELLCT